MKRWLSLLLLAGALFGLIGQEAAIACPVPSGKSAPAVAAAPMDADCAEKMGLKAPAPQPQAPCDGSPECMAKMGCAVHLAVLPILTAHAPQAVRAALPPQAPAAPLRGRETIPEPDPPARFG